MRYLKAKISDATYSYIPLDHAEFRFYERGTKKYAVGIFMSGQYIPLTKEGKERTITSLDDFMADIADIPDRHVVDVAMLFSKYGDV